MTLLSGLCFKKVTRLQSQPHQPDYILFFTVVILSAVGVLTVFSASTVYSLHNGLPANYFAVRQFISAAIGILIMSAISRISYKFWFRRAPLLMLLNLILLALVLIPGIGQEANGGRRWIGTSSLHLQPSEIAIITIVIYLSFFFTKKAAVLSHFKLGLRPALILIGLNFILIMLEPDMGTAVALVGTALVVLIVSGTRLRPLLILGGILVPILLVLSLTSYRFQRIISFLHPFAHSGGSAYQVIQGWTGIAAGGWFGRGFGQSIEKTGYLPFPQTDFIFPVFVEEWGFVGAIAMLIVFGVMIWRGFAIARHSADRFSALLAVGLTSMITIPTIINLGAVTGLMPVTGIPLPFISYGGTALIVNLGAMGMLLSISRSTLQEELDTDQLADVLSDEDAPISNPVRETPVIQLWTRQSQPSRKTGRVHPLPRKSSNNSKETWRARQEMMSGRTQQSATREATRSSSNNKKIGAGTIGNKRATSSSPTPSSSGWRARNSTTPTPTKNSSSSSRGTWKSKPSRKD